MRALAYFNLILHEGSVNLLQRNMYSKLTLQVEVWGQCCLHIDFVGPFLGKMFLVVVDAYSKFLEVVPMATATSVGTIKALRRLFAVFGLPVHIVSDNGTQFTSSEFVRVRMVLLTLALLQDIPRRTVWPRDMWDI